MQYENNALIKNPAGTYHFVGSVSAVLAYVTKDGEMPTQKQLENAGEFGPRLAGVKTRTFKTVEDAVQFATEHGVEVGSIHH